MEDQKNNDLSQIRGWLLFLIIALVVIAPFLNIKEWVLSSHHVGDKIIGIVLSIVSIFLGLLLITKKKISIIFLRVWLIFLVLFNTLITISNFDTAGVPYGFHAVLANIIWVMYTFKSKRIKAVYYNK